MKALRAGIIISASFFWTCAFAQVQPRVVPGEYLIKLKKSSAGSSMLKSKIFGKASFKAAVPGADVIHIRMNVDANEKTTIEELRGDPAVEYLEPNYILEKFEVNSGVPVHTFGQNDLSAMSISYDPSIYSQSSANTRVADAWKIVSPLSNSNGKVVVAIIDTGLDRNQELFKPYVADGSGGSGALWVNDAEANGLPGVDDDRNGYIDDLNGWNFMANTPNFADDDNHGTHCAGIVVGAGLNIFARPLEESKIQVMPLKFLGADGAGTTANAIRAINYAVANGARVINNSWGGSSYSRSLQDAIANAYSHQVLVVNAAGNFSSDNDVNPLYPANYEVPGSMAVASTKKTDELSVFSNYGALSVSIGSPGEAILSTVPSSLTSNSYAMMSGTSMATPFVSGLAALAFRESPQLSGYQMKELLMQSGQLIRGLYGKIFSGARVDAYSLIYEAQQMAGSNTVQPSYTPTYEGERSLASTSGTSPIGGGCGLVKAITNKGPGDSGSSPQSVGVLFVLLLLPLAVWRNLNTRVEKSGRRHERFKMNSEIKVNVGGREIVGQLNTISEGGLSFNADSALEKGGIVTMKIQSPDGHEMIEVHGHIVWNESNQSYGVQFDDAKKGAIAMIRDWTKGLLKA